MICHTEIFGDIFSSQFLGFLLEVYNNVVK